MTTLQSNCQKFSLMIDMLFAYGFTWLCWLPGLIIGTQQDYVMPTSDVYAY